MLDTEVQELIRLSAQTRRLLQFSYTYTSGKREGQTVTEVVAPTKISFPYFHGDKLEYPKDKGIRKFYIPNMENVVVLEREFRPRWPIEVY